MPRFSIHPTSRSLIVLGVGLGFVLGGFGGLAGCEKNNKPPPPSTGGPGMPETGPKGASHNNGGDSPAMAAAEERFQTKCAMCHGLDGAGHGPMAEQLNPKPRNYTDATWQASVSDEELKKVITLGGQAVGKSAMMPANLDLRDQPEVLDALVKIIRRFGKK